MKIALINENSQASKNALICENLKAVVEPMGHTVYNYGMYSEEDEIQLTYVMEGLLASILLNAKAVDYVVTGCGTGQGAAIALNSFPGVQCGHILDVEEGYLFTQINDGNAIALPYAKGFGWGAEIHLRYVFDKVFSSECGGGYPADRAEAQKRNKKILDQVKEVTQRDILTVMKTIDQDFLKTTVGGEHFAEYFFPNCQVPEIAEYLKGVLGIAE